MVLERNGRSETRDLERCPHRLLGHPNAERRIGQHKRCLIERVLHQVFVGDDVQDESSASGLICVDESTGEHHLVRRASPDEPGKEPGGADVAAGDADLDEGGGEPCAHGGKTDVGAEHERKSTACRRAVHRSDHRLRQTAQVQHQVGDLLLGGKRHSERTVCGIDGRRRRSVAVEVEPRAESSASTGQDHHPHAGIVAEVIEARMEVADERGGHRVQALRAIERQDGDPVDRARQGDGLTHRKSLSREQPSRSSSRPAVLSISRRRSALASSWW